MKTLAERSVIDTNILVSAFLSPQSLPAQALALLQRSGIVLASRETLQELEEVLTRPKFDKWASVHKREMAFLRFLASVEPIQITEVITECVDPKDDKFLSLAVSGNASLILTGDDHLLRLHPFRGIAILKPADYLAR